VQPAVRRPKLLIREFWALRELMLDGIRVGIDPRLKRPVEEKDRLAGRTSTR
jgi:hypothetical protein